MQSASDEIPSKHQNGENEKPAGENDDYRTSRGTRFRLKTRRSSKRKHDDERDHKHRTHHSSDRHGQRQSRKRHKSSRMQEKSVDPPLSPNAAFRESLFDALADDEGAAYWEGVYGQPIHTYPRPEDAPDGRGELERMTDEEYATYVRTRMWEKTHQAVLEERERRRRLLEAEREEKRKREDYRKTETEREAFERMIDDSLRRGKDRKERKKKAGMWIGIWARYIQSWKTLDALARNAASASDAPTGLTPSLRKLIDWPVKSGKRRDITPQAVEEFMRNAPPLPHSGSGTPKLSSQGVDNTGLQKPDILTTLKAERVRWHPDKIKHRYGILGMEDQIDKSATEVFQILDRIWVEERTKLEAV